MLDIESEMQDLFIHHQYSQGGRFSAPKRPHFSGGYRVRINDRRIALQPHSSGPQERRGSVQDQRLQLKYHPEMHTKSNSLDNPNYFRVGFTSGSAFGYLKILVGFDTYIIYVGNFRKMNCA